jgi:diguanylate cyclase (GGDEF)-like protein
LLAVAAAHHVAGRQITLYSFFVLPCALAAWSVGQGTGLLVAGLSALIQLASDLALKGEIGPVVLIVNAGLRLALYVFVAWGTDVIGRLFDQLAHLSRYDALTGLGNRGAFMLRGAEEVERARRTERPFSMVFLDLDHFKSVNDRLGHAAGDALLRRVGVVLRTRLRSVDFPARLGGDEFAALLPETDGAGARHVGHDLHAMLRGEFAAMRHPVSVSIGVATFVRAPASFDEALRRADQLMYAVKNASKDAVLQEDFA